MPTALNEPVSRVRATLGVEGQCPVVVGVSGSVSVEVLCLIRQRPSTGRLLPVQPHLGCGIGQRGGNGRVVWDSTLNLYGVAGKHVGGSSTTTVSAKRNPIIASACVGYGNASRRRTCEVIPCG